MLHNNYSYMIHGVSSGGPKKKYLWGQKSFKLSTKVFEPGICGFNRELSNQLHHK